MYSYTPIHIHLSNSTHKLLNTLKHTFGTRLRRTNMRLKPKLLTQMIPRRRSNSSNKDLPISTSFSTSSKRP